MPKQVDHEQRRAQLAEALWRITERDGIGAATVRRVAAEAGVSVGMVQHYFSTKDEMLLFALRWIGEEFGARLITRITAVPEPRDPYEVVWITLAERLPTEPRQRIYVQALVTWLANAPDNPELGRYLVEGTRRLRDHLANQLGHLPDPGLVADGLLAFTDGLSSHVLQNLLTADRATEVLKDHLDRLFH